jgi:transposase
VPALKKDGEDQAVGRSRGGPTTKIHAVVDALGNPVAPRRRRASGRHHAVDPLEGQPEAAAQDRFCYRERNLVERFFCTLKNYRAIATRYDKLASTLLAGILLVCAGSNDPTDDRP